MFKRLIRIIEDIVEELNTTKTVKINFVMFLGVTTTTQEGRYNVTRLDPSKKFSTSQWR